MKLEWEQIAGGALLGGLAVWLYNRQQASRPAGQLWNVWSDNLGVTPRLQSGPLPAYQDVRNHPWLRFMAPAPGKLTPQPIQWGAVSDPEGGQVLYPRNYDYRPIGPDLSWGAVSDPEGGQLPR